MRVVLISTYELGRQPFGLASPAAWLRAAGHEVTQADLSRGQIPVEAVESADLHAALADLSDRDRRLLEMRYREDLTQATIARRLGIPEGTVKVRLHRARNKLRRAYVLQ